MPRRNFLPPAVCDACKNRPALGDTLWHSGVAWLCPACLADKTFGDDSVTKAVSESVMYEENRARSRRDRAAGDIESADYHERLSNWHGHAVGSLQSHGNRRAKSALIASGEAAASPGYLKDTLANPDLIAIESSEMRGKLLLTNGVAALGIDVANTAGASNTHEKLISHQIALAHKTAMEQANKALHEHNPVIEVKRLQIAARMIAMAQQGVITLKKLKTGGTQNVVVQHVYVADGGQAVIGAVQAGGCKQDEK